MLPRSCNCNEKDPFYFKKCHLAYREGHETRYSILKRCINQNVQLKNCCVPLSLTGCFLGPVLLLNECNQLVAAFLLLKFLRPFVSGISLATKNILLKVTEQLELEICETKRSYIDKPIRTIRFHRNCIQPLNRTVKYQNKKKTT